MWHSYRTLNRLSFALIVVSSLYIFYACFKVAINSEVFKVKTINFIGDINHVTREQFSAVVLSNFKGGFFDLNLDHAKNALEDLSWVKSVRIKRNWPNAVDITVLERHELARWNDGGLIDASGELFNGAADKKLPVLEGPVNQHAEMVAVYLRLMKILEPFKVSVDRLILSRQQAWYGHLSSGLEVAMGEQNIESRLERFMRFLPDAESRFKSSIKYVDLRYTNGFSVSSSVNGGNGS